MRQERTFWLLAASIALLAFLPYLQSAWFDFVMYDDNQYVTSNLVVRKGLTFSGIGWAFTSLGFAANWHPLTWLSLMTDVSLFGVSSGAMHLVNAAFHAANAVLLFLLLHRLTGRLDAAFLAAALWAVHPLRVESVAWVTERKDVLSTFFGLAAAVCYLKAVRPAAPAGSARSAWILLATGLFALGFMAKPAVVTLPALAALLEYAVSGRVRWRHIELLVWMAVAGMLVTIYAQGQGGAVAGAADVPPPLRVWNSIASVGTYVRQTFWPANLAVLYPLRMAVPKGSFAFGLLVCAAAGVAFWATCFSARARAAGPVAGGSTNLRSRLPYAVAIGWFLVALAPMLGILQVGAQAHADRYTYWPSIGLAIGTAWAIAQFRSASPPSAIPSRVVFPALAAAAAVLGAAATRQVAVWRDTETILGVTAARTSPNPIADQNLGIYLCLKGRPHEGLAQLRRSEASLTRAPALPRTGFETRLAWGLALAGSLDEAGALALRLREADSSSGLPPLVLGMIARQRHALAAAEHRIRAVLREHPGLAVAWWEYGKVLADQRRWPEAKAAWQRTHELDPWLGPDEASMIVDARAAASPAVDWRSLIESDD